MVGAHGGGTKAHREESGVAAAGCQGRSNPQRQQQAANNPCRYTGTVHMAAAGKVQSMVTAVNWDFLRLEEHRLCKLGLKKIYLHSSQNSVINLSLLMYKLSDLI